MRIQRLVAACALALALAPSAAFADTFITPFLGVNFGGDVGRPLGVALEDRNRMTWGVNVASMGAGIFGMELDFGYTSNFYTDTNSVVTENNAMTLMPALIIGIPVGGQQGVGLRPYVLAGAGLIRRDFEVTNIVSASENDFGYTLGGGVMGFLGDHFGIRGDLRYFRNFQVDEFGFDDVDFDQGTFNFGRASVGAIFRF